MARNAPLAAEGPRCAPRAGRCLELMPDCCKPNPKLDSCWPMPVGKLPPEVCDVISECGRLPLALAICGACSCHGRTSETLRYLGPDKPQSDPRRLAARWHKARAFARESRIARKRFPPETILGLTRCAPSDAEWNCSILFLVLSTRGPCRVFENEKPPFRCRRLSTSLSK